MNAGTWCSSQDCRHHDLSQIHVSHQVSFAFLLYVSAHRFTLQPSSIQSGIKTSLACIQPLRQSCQEQPQWNTACDIGSA